MISRLAIESLPAAVPAFLRTSRAAALVGELAREPDRSKGAGDSHDHDRDPGHYINLSDDFAVAGVVPIDPLPATREDYDSALRSKGTDEYKAGFLPYAIVDGWQQLQKDFAYWRADVAAERSVASKTDRAWFARDRRLREMIVLRDLGYWSHFVADASQPMHVSIHRDGWGDYPNPQAYSATKGFHAAFEGAFVARYVRPEDITNRLRPSRDCECSIQTATVAYLRESMSYRIPSHLTSAEPDSAFSYNHMFRSSASRKMMMASLAVLLIAQYNHGCHSRSTYTGHEMHRAIAPGPVAAAQTTTLGISTCRNSTIVLIMKRFT